MPGIVIMFVIGLFYLATDGSHRLNRGNNVVGLTEIIIAVLVGFFLYVAEFQPQMFGKYCRSYED